MLISVAVLSGLWFALKAALGFALFLGGMLIAGSAPDPGWWHE